MKKRFVCMLMLVALVCLVSLALLPTQAAAKNAEIETTATHSHPICGSSCDCASTSHSSTTWTAWDGTTKLYTGDYYLTQDIVLDHTMILDYSYTTRLCLNGHSITCEDMVFNIYSYRMLLITDCVGTGKVETTNSSCTISNNKYLSIWGGTITNSSGNAFGTISAWSGTTTYVCGGRVEAEDGVAIYSDPGSKIYIEGGTVHGGGYSAAIDCNGGSGGISTLKVTGGRITADYTSAVNFAYNFQMTGGYIDGDVSVWSEEGTTTISGGTINGMLDTSSGQTTITGGDMSLWLSGADTTISAGTFRGTCYFAGTNATVSGGDFSACDKVVIRGKTWICGGYFSLIQTESANLYLSGVPSIESLQMRDPAVVSAQNMDGTGSFGGDPIEVRLDHPYTTTAWEDGDIIVKNVKSDAVAEKFTLAGEDAEWMYLERSGTNLVLRLVPHGTCGDDATWFFDPKTNTLTISGTGAMDDYTSNGTPWADYQKLVQTIVIEEGITSIGNCAFKYFEKLDQLILPDSLQSISYESFLYCPGLKELVLPENVRDIGSYAFEQCVGLESVVFPAGMTTITGFNACTSLKTVTIPESVTTIAFNAFNNCSALTDVYYDGTKAQWEQIVVENPDSYNKYFANATVHYTRCKDGHSWTEATCAAPKTCEVCGITEGDLGDHVRDSDHKCTVCGQIGGTCGENLTWTLDVNGVLTISGTGDMYDFTFAQNRPWANYWYDIKTVVIEDGATSIGNCAFDGCTQLTSVTIPEGVSRIGNNAFFGCDALTGILLPVGLVSIGNNAFFACDALTGIILPVGLVSIGNDAFNGCTNMSSVILPNGLTSIGDSAFEWCIKLSDVIIPDTVTHIGNAAFYDCISLTIIAIPDGVTHIGDEAFMLCTCLESIAFGANSQLTSIGASAFYCSGLTTIDIPGGVSSIGDNAFGSCSDLTEITFMGDAPTIGENAFEYVTATAYYPGGNATWTADVMQNYGGTITWVINCTHDWVDATCTAPKTCAICGATEGEALGHSYGGWYVASMASCTTDGQMRRDCQTCGHYETDVIPATGHSYDAVVTEPTCTEEGYTTYTCATCGDSYTDDYVSAVGHNYCGWYVASPATCTTDGQMRNDCQNCDHYETDVIAATGHSYDAVVTEPTCTEEGYTTYTCTVCGDSYTDDYVSATDHNYGGWYVASPATCITDGQMRNDCQNCDHYETGIIPATGHSYESVVTEPTCTEQGFTTYTCACGDSYVDNYVDALGHQAVVDEAVEPTCTENGLTEGSHCDVCGEVLVAQTQIPATGHDYAAVVTAPTCTEEGFTTYTCTVCGDRYTDNHTDALGHQAVVDEAVEPTCTEDGLTEGNHCDVCGEVLSTQVVIPATGHLDEDRNFLCDTCGADLCTEHVEQIIPAILPTCTEEGMTEGVKCANCGEILVAREKIPALGHDYDAVVTEPTCTEEGFTTYTCTVCGDRNVSDHVDALGHQEVIDEGVAATCTEDGLSEGSHCSVCGEVLTEQEVIPAIGHLDENNDFICDICGADLCTEHIVETITEKLPTCTEDGMTEGVKCANCGEILVAQEVIPALGHSMGQWYEEIAPTCTETGLRRTDCERCDYFETEKIAAKGHNYAGVVTAPTCTEIGYTTYTCEHCGDSYIDEFVAANGHSFGEWVTDREPTCTESGRKSRTCVCGETETEELSALGHVFQDGKCSRCGELDAATEAVPGDVNGDGKVDTTDAKLIMQFDLGMIDETVLNLSVADVNGDGKVDTTDAKLIMQLDLGIIIEFPTP